MTDDWQVYSAHGQDTITRTYTGMSKDYRRRIFKEHGRTKKSARATQGQTWKPLYVISGFKTRSHACQFEKALHMLSRGKKKLPDLKPSDVSYPANCPATWKRRLFHLYALIRQPQWTRNGPRVNTYDRTLSIRFFPLVLTNHHASLTEQFSYSIYRVVSL